MLIISFSGHNNNKFTPGLLLRKMGVSVLPVFLSQFPRKSLKFLSIPTLPGCFPDIPPVVTRFSARDKEIHKRSWYDSPQQAVSVLSVSLFLGRNPSKQNRSLGNPDSTRAGTKAVAPGRHSTSTPSLMQALTSRKPGSEIAGVPASEINAILSPAFIRSTASAVVLCSLNLWCDCMRVSIPKCFNRLPLVRVSSANIRSHSFSRLSALNVMSSKLPTGVGTTYSFPVAMFY